MTSANTTVYHVEMNWTPPANNPNIIGCDCPIYEVFSPELNEYFLLGRVHLDNMKPKKRAMIRGFISTGKWRLHRPLSNR